MLLTNNKIFFKNLYLVFLMLMIAGCGGGGGGSDPAKSSNIVIPQNAIQYSYDSDGRLISETRGDGKNVKYKYDNNGNMLARIVQ